MKQANLLLTGITAVALVSAAACTKKVAAVNQPPAPVPVATTSPQPASTPVQSRPAASTQQKQAAAPERSTAMPASVRKRLTDELAKLEDALFDYDQSSIRSDASAALRDDVNVIREILAEYPNQKLVIEGHTDERGSAEYNLALGDRRAHAVQEFLSSMGIPGSQLSVISLGKERPVCTDQVENCWQRNRRAHITVAP